MQNERRRAYFIVCRTWTWVKLENFVSSVIMFSDDIFFPHSRWPGVQYFVLYLHLNYSLQAILISNAGREIRFSFIVMTGKVLIGCYIDRVTFNTGQNGSGSGHGAGMS